MRHFTFHLCNFSIIAFTLVFSGCNREEILERSSTERLIWVRSEFTPAARKKVGMDIYFNSNNQFGTGSPYNFVFKIINKNTGATAFSKTVTSTLPGGCCSGDLSFLIGTNSPEDLALKNHLLNDADGDEYELVFEAQHLQNASKSVWGKVHFKTPYEAVDTDQGKKYRSLHVWLIF